MVRHDTTRIGKTNAYVDFLRREWEESGGKSSGGYLHSLLKSRFPEKADDELPSKRTIERLIKSWRPVDESEPWQLGDEDDIDAALILPVLGTVAVKTRARTTHLTLAEARWATRIRRAAPKTPPWITYLLAREYLVREERGAETAGLDLLLAVGRREIAMGSDAWLGYADLLDKGLPAPPGHILVERVIQSLFGSSAEERDPMDFVAVAELLGEGPGDAIRSLVKAATWSKENPDQAREFSQQYKVRAARCSNEK